MKLKYCVAALTMGVASGACAHISNATIEDSAILTPDSIALQQLNEAVVMAVKAPEHAPFAVTRIKDAEIASFATTGQELPFLFARTPGIVAWSENGIGTGTTYMRMRGSGDSRINVTLDGVSLNSPEDQCVFWANMNSYAALLSDVQITRGVGTSTNGDGAFGGTIAMKTKSPSLKPSLQLSAAGGSYGTWNFGGNFSTGLFARNHIVIDGAYHETRTDGYIHGTNGRSGSYYGGLTVFNRDRSFKMSYKNIGNFEKTGQAWNGIDTKDLLDWNYGGMGTGIFSYKDMYKAGLGRFNTLYERLNDEGDPTQGTSRYTMNDGSLWPRTTDNFWQNHNLLNFSWRIDDNWKTSITAHYTHGHGYYDEFRYDNKFSKFGLPTITLDDDTKVKRGDFVRQKGLTQDTYGVIWNVGYTSRALDFTMGASLQNFQGNHWGYVTYMPDIVRNYLLSQSTNAYGAPVFGTGKHANDYHYYDSDAQKEDDQVFAKATWHINSHLDLFGDVQYRFVSFFTDGINDKFYDALDNQPLDIKKEYHFVNPKAGLNYHNGPHTAYASYALSHREPERNNFTDNGAYPAPHAEQLHDLELGYGFANALWHASAGAYAMLYHNQFVQTGEYSEIGEALTTNIKRSYRLGLEMSAGINVTKWLALEANAAISQNKVKDFTECVENWDVWEGNGDDGIVNFVAADGTGFTRIHYSNSTLAFSPTAIVNGFADFHYRGFQATWHTAFVSKQYLDNTKNDCRALPRYTRTDIALAYDLKVAQKGLKNIVFGVNLNNIFNSHYASAGWVYSAIAESYGNSNASRYTEIGYIPQAGFTAMGSITLKF